MLWRLRMEEAMRAERVQVSWDSNKSKWVVRIEASAEVIRRHLDVPKDADDQTLRSAAQKTVQDEGYEVDFTEIVVHRLI
jgi:hypothetical protein